MARKNDGQTAELPADHTASEIAATQEPAALAESNGKKTREPSKTRHMSAQRAVKVESVIGLLIMSVDATDENMKQAALTLALHAVKAVKEIDAQIVKVQSES